MKRPNRNRLLTIAVGGALFVAGTTGCGEAQSGQAAPARATDKVEAVDLTFSEADLAKVNAVVKGVASIGLENAGVRVVSGSEAYTCAANGNGFGPKEQVVTSTTKKPVYCRATSMALIPAGWANDMVAKMGGDRDPVDRNVALTFIAAGATGMTMRAQAGVDPARTELGQFEQLSCYAGRIIDHVNRPLVDATINDLQVFERNGGLDLWHDFMTGTMGDNCADR